MNRPKRSQLWAVYLLVVLASAVAGAVPAHAAGESAAGESAVDESAAGTDAAPAVRRAHSNLRARDPAALRTRDPAAALAKRLDLNEKQTAEVRRLLVVREARMRAIWTDAAIGADDRVGAVKAINEKTQAQIRALLTEEQSKRYIQPRPSGSPATGSKPSVEKWMNATRPRQGSADRGGAN